MVTLPYSTLLYSLSSQLTSNFPAVSAAEISFPIFLTCSTDKLAELEEVEAISWGN